MRHVVLLLGGLTACAARVPLQTTVSIPVQDPTWADHPEAFVHLGARPVAVPGAADGACACDDRRLSCAVEDGWARVTVRLAGREDVVFPADRPMGTCKVAGELLQVLGAPIVYAPPWRASDALVVAPVPRGQWLGFLVATSPAAVVPGGACEVLEDTGGVFATIEPTMEGRIPCLTREEGPVDLHVVRYEGPPQGRQARSAGSVHPAVPSQ